MTMEHYIYKECSTSANCINVIRNVNVLLNRHTCMSKTNETNEMKAYELGLGLQSYSNTTTATFFEVHWTTKNQYIGAKQVVVGQGIGSIL